MPKSGAPQTAAQSAPSLSIVVPLPRGQVGEAYCVPLTATSGVPPLRWAVSGELPPGLTLDPSTGDISGTPTSAGEAIFMVSVTDSLGSKAADSLSISVATAVTITTTALPAGEVGVPYSETLAATGGTPPYTWAVTAGSLPQGLTLDAATGTISGTPTVAGTVAFTVTVTDSAGATASTTLTLTVARPVHIYTFHLLPVGVVGDPYTATLVARLGVPPYTWTVSTGRVPPGLRLDPSTGIISGVPTATGRFRFTVTVTDSAGGQASKRFEITVAAA